MFVLSESGGESALTDAVLTMSPGNIGAVATMERTVESPLFREAIKHVTERPSTEHPSEAETNEVPLGRVSTTVMLLAVAGPLLVMVTV